jgi:hypothetical protein
VGRGQAKLREHSCGAIEDRSSVLVVWTQLLEILLGQGAVRIRTSALKKVRRE